MEMIDKLFQMSSKSSKSGKNIIIVISLDQNTAAPIMIFPQA